MLVHESLLVPEVALQFALPGDRSVREAAREFGISVVDSVQRWVRRDQRSGQSSGSISPKEVVVGTVCRRVEGGR